MKAEAQAAHFASLLNTRGQYRKIGKQKNGNSVFSVKDMHCQPILTFLWLLIEWLIFCQNSWTCYLFSTEKNWISSIFSIPFLFYFLFYLFFFFWCCPNHDRWWAYSHRPAPCPCGDCAAFYAPVCVMIMRLWCIPRPTGNAFPYFIEYDKIEQTQYFDNNGRLFWIRTNAPGIQSSFGPTAADEHFGFQTHFFFPF